MQAIGISRICWRDGTWKPLAVVAAKWAARFGCNRAGQGFNELAEEYGCSSRSNRQWVKQTDRDQGRGDGG
jgi:predicted transcriptional regulator